MRIINRPRWWVLLLFIPIVNLIMFPVVWVETLRSFGKNSTTDTILGVVTLGLYIYYINYAVDVTYIGSDRDLKPRSKTGDTVSSLLFAVVVATIVHTYIMQPFTIPTSSLEKTLLVGDFLFVSKFHYGAKTPMTTVAAPMVHDTIPFINKRSYSKWPQLPYFRLPGIESVEKNDIVVFNWPADTVTKFFDRSAVGLRKPIDKKSNYVKRCVGTPGDNLSIVDGSVFINGQELKLSDRAKLQFDHTVYSKNGVQPQLLKQSGSTEFLRTFSVVLTSQDQIDALSPYIRNIERNSDGSYTVTTSQNGVPTNVLRNYGIGLQEIANNNIVANLTFEGAEMLRNITGIDSVVRHIMKIPEPVFGNSQGWNRDNMGPIYIPEKGKSVQLTVAALPFYKKIIEEYEHNDLKVNGSEIRINGQVVTSYTFKQNYYWMMGDNRHHSEDSRFWGFVPEDHIVGKPVLVWMSIDQNEPWSNISKKIRWERLFTTVGGDGQPVSYFKYFLIVLAAWFVFDYFRKKKRASKI
ncbi:MAG: signal peptidase I [Flavobacterium sp.]|nr:MAG: signal peptidase I [Flavobacterium sp.]